MIAAYATVRQRRFRGIQVQAMFARRALPIAGVIDTCAGRFVA
jgi:hypothetical protein